MITVIFGNPGCGKTTDAIKRAKKALKHKKYSHSYCNFYHTCPSVHICNLEDLGEWTFENNSLILVDESGIEYNSRAYKSLPKPAIAWFKKHRHYGADVVLYSQSFEDMDVTLRRLAVEYWHMRRIGPWSLSRRIYKTVGIDRNTKQIIDAYQYASPLWLFLWPLQYLTGNFRWRLTFRPFYYRYFNSWETDNIPVRDFPCGNVV